MTTPMMQLDRASQILVTLIGVGAVTAALMPSAENVLIEPTDTAGLFACRVCASLVSRGKPGMHEQQVCVLASPRSGHGESA